MKKKVLSIIIVIALMVLGSMAFVYAKPNKSINALWGNVLAKDKVNNKSKDERNKKTSCKSYKLTLKGKCSENIELTDKIVKAGKDILITEAEIEKAAEFYMINGEDEETANEKAVEYVEEQNAMYIEAINNGYDVTDEELDEYVEELKCIVSTAENKEMAEEIINAFDSEEEYWEYEREVYKKLLPIQKYVKTLEKEFVKNNISNKTEQEIGKEWYERFKGVKEKAVKRQKFKEVKNDDDIDDKFLYNK